MKGKGVSKENAEKAQLKAKAREPGKIFFPLCLLSFWSTLSFFPIFLPFFLTSLPALISSLLFSHLHFTFIICPSYLHLCSVFLFSIILTSLTLCSLPGARAKKAEAAAASSGGLESGESKVELVKRPRDYAVTFSFPEVSKSSSLPSLSFFLLLLLLPLLLILILLLYLLIFVSSKSSPLISSLSPTLYLSLSITYTCKICWLTGEYN